MRGLQKIIAMFGRLFISVIFILSALKKIFDWQNTESGLINLFCDWQSYVAFSVSLQKIFAGMISWASEILIVVTILEVIGGFLVFFGLKPRFGSFLLFLFFLPATILLHPFWALDGSKKELQTIMFFKNLAIIGGLLYIMAFGNKTKEPKIEFPPMDDKKDGGEDNFEE